MDGLHRELRPPPLHHRRFLRIWLAAVGKPERAVREQPARVDVRRRLRDGKRHAFVGGKCSPERSALLHVGHGLLEGDLGHAEAGERDDDSVVVEALHDLIEARALRPEPMGCRNPDVIEGEHGARYRAGSQIPERASRDAGQVERDQERGHAPRLGIGVGASEHDGRLRHHSEADPGLLARDQVRRRRPARRGRTRLAASEPTPGSVRARATMVSPRAVEGNQRAFISSLPLFPRISPARPASWMP